MVRKPVSASLLGGCADGCGDLLLAGAGLAGGSDGAELQPSEQFGQLLIGSEGVQRFHDGRSVQTGGEGHDLLCVACSAGFGDLVSEGVVVAPGLPGT